MSIPTVVPICWMCKHWQPGVKDPLGVSRCPAFPDGIPDEIRMAGFDHRQPLGNETTLFEPADGVTPERIAEWEDRVQETTDNVARSQMGIPRDDFDAEDDED